MKLGIDLCFRMGGGTITWIAALFKNLRALRPDLQGVVFTSAVNVENRLLPDCGDWPVEMNRTPRVVGSDRVRTIADQIWQQAVVPRLARKHGVDVLFSIGNRTPLRCGCARVQLVGNALTIWPGVRDPPLSWLQRFHYAADGRMIAAGAARAEVVITESQFELDLLREHFGVVPRRSFVLNNGRSDEIQVVPSADEVASVLARYGLLDPFLLCVAHITCHSNHARLVRTYARATADLDTPVPFVLCGGFRHEWMRPEVMRTIDEAGLRDRVLLLGNVDRLTLAVLYRTCRLFVYPSLVEGFAYTLVEAMSCGAPIICSRAPAMPETCGDAAVYFDPEDVSDIAD